ncbi:MAG TPA: hypothetical protein VGC09_20070 [Rhodopila sp.]
MTENDGTENGGTENRGTENVGTENVGTDNGGTDNGGSENAETASERFTADLAALRQDVARLAEDMSQLLHDQTRAAGTRAAEVIGGVADKIQSTVAGAPNRVCSAGRAIEAGIERNALTAVLIAFGVGISIGLLTRLRGR